MGALGSATALAPTPVLPKAAAESGGGAVAGGAGAAGGAGPRKASASSGSTAAGHRLEGVTPCTR